MILREDYVFEYNMFLAEKELYSSLCNLSVINESVILEGLNDTVTNYLNKVTTNIQTVWEKFKSTVGNQNSKDYLTKVAEKIRTANPRFTINNYPNYDLNILKSYKVTRYNRQTMYNDLKIQKVYKQKYYPSLYSERNNMNVMMRKNVVRGYINLRCDKNSLTKSYNFCSTGFYEARKSIEEDINIINEAVSNITHSINTVKSTQESVDLCIDMINEAITNGVGAKPTNKMSFVDSDGSKVDPGDKNAQNQNSFINEVVNYMRVSTDLISAKMKVLASMYKDNMDIVKHYVDITQYGEPKQNNQANQVQV